MGKAKTEGWKRREEKGLVRVVAVSFRDKACLFV